MTRRASEAEREYVATSCNELLSSTWVLSLMTRRYSVLVLLHLPRHASTCVTFVINDLTAPHPPLHKKKHRAISPSTEEKTRLLTSSKSETAGAKEQAGDAPPYGCRRSW